MLMWNTYLRKLGKVIYTSTLTMCYRACIYFVFINGVGKYFDIRCFVKHIYKYKMLMSSIYHHLNLKPHNTCR